MTRANPIIPGYYLVTRRTLGGLFRMRPSREVNALIEYLVAVGAERYDIEVIAFKALSNHWHAVIYDNHGNHREWVQYINSFLARALNVIDAGKDHVFSGIRNPSVLLADADALMRATVYVIGNSVRSDLTDRAKEWPGFVTLPKALVSLCRPIQRPKVLFKVDGSLPATARLRLYKPHMAGVSGIIGGRVTAQSFRGHVAKELSKMEADRRRERRARRVKPLGRERILSASPFDTGGGKFRVEEVGDDGKSQRVAPRVATRNVSLRVALLEWFARFQEEYRNAWRQLRGNNAKGRAAPRFPFGTNLLRARLEARCEGVPEDFPVEVMGRC